MINDEGRQKSNKQKKDSLEWEDSTMVSDRTSSSGDEGRTKQPAIIYFKWGKKEKDKACCDNQQKWNKEDRWQVFASGQ